MTLWFELVSPFSRSWTFLESEFESGNKEPTKDGGLGEDVCSRYVPSGESMGQLITPFVIVSAFDTSTLRPCALLVHTYRR